MLNILYGFVIVREERLDGRIFTAGIGIDIQRAIIITLDDILFGFHACSFDFQACSIGHRIVNRCFFLRQAGGEYQKYQDRVERYYFPGKELHALPPRLLQFLDNPLIHDPREDLHEIGIKLLAGALS